MIHFGFTMGEFILELRDIVKRFSDVEVLHKVSFNLRPGEVHALLGEIGIRWGALFIMGIASLIGGRTPCQKMNPMSAKTITPTPIQIKLNLGFCLRFFSCCCCRCVLDEARFP